MPSCATAPRATLLLLAYNQERYVADAARSCCAQEGEALQIVLSDDASHDGTHAILESVAAAYDGPHRVVVRRNERNLGIAAHYNRLIDETCGELLITAAGDDVSSPDRAARLLAAWDATDRRADLITSHVFDVDSDGVDHGVLRVADLAALGGIEGWCRRRPFVIGAGHAFTRRLMRRFGAMDGAIPYEDQIIVFRALTSGGAVTIDTPLVRYRRGGESAKPAFDSAAQEHAWRLRRLGGEIAEREQLLRDAAVAGCLAEVSAALEPLRVRQAYLSRLYGADSALARLQALFMADGPSRAWRFSKWMQATTAVARIRSARRRSAATGRSA